MRAKRFGILFGLVVACASVALPSPAAAQTQASPADKTKQPPKRKPDLGDAAEGTFVGQIISDSRGSSSAAGTQVVVTIRRTGVNRIEVTTDNPLLRGGLYQLESAMGRILARATKSNLLIDPTRQPANLDYSPDEVLSFSGVRQ